MAHSNPLVTAGNWPLELGRRADYILVRCCHHGPTLDIAACADLQRASGRRVATDHFGVVADLAVAAFDDPCWSRSE